MEFREFVFFLKKNILQILIVGVIFAVLSVLAFFFLPVRYKATGSLFITRKADETSAELFTYEGYYAQQTAHSYTNTIGGLLESVDIKKKVLESLEIPVTQRTIRRLSRQLQIKRPALQLLVVEVKGKTAGEARSLWLSLVDEVVEVSLDINKVGDSSISVLQLSDLPVVQPTYRNVYLFGLVGFGFGLFLGVLISALKEYFK